jgi:hypothetical protein
MEERHTSVFLLIVFLFFLLPISLWPILMTIAIMLVYFRTKRNFRAEEKKNVESIWAFYIDLVKDKQVCTSPNTFRYNKAPNKIKYIFHHPELVSCMENLYVLQRFNPMILADILILIEHFCRIHYKAILEKYDPVLSVQPMLDIKQSVNALFDQMIFNVPKVSSTIDVADIDVFVNDQKSHMNVVLTKYIQIFRNKYHAQCEHILAFASS